MAVYIVTYDLRNEKTGDKYNRLISLIKQDGIWACLGESSYLVESELSAVELRNRYREVLNLDDMLFVGVLTAPAAWYGYSQQITDWIKTKL